MNNNNIFFWQRPDFPFYFTEKRCLFGTENAESNNGAESQESITETAETIDVDSSGEAIQNTQNKTLEKVKAIHAGFNPLAEGLRTAGAVTDLSLSGRKKQTEKYILKEVKEQNAFFVEGASNALASVQATVGFMGGRVEERMNTIDAALGVIEDNLHDLQKEKRDIESRTKNISALQAAQAKLPAWALLRHTKRVAGKVSEGVRTVGKSAVMSGRFVTGKLREGEGGNYIHKKTEETLRSLQSDYQQKKKSYEEKQNKSTRHDAGKIDLVSKTFGDNDEEKKNTQSGIRELFDWAKEQKRSIPKNMNEFLEEWRNDLLYKNKGNNILKKIDAYLYEHDPTEKAKNLLEIQTEIKSSNDNDSEAKVFAFLLKTEKLEPRTRREMMRMIDGMGAGTKMKLRQESESGKKELENAKKKKKEEIQSYFFENENGDGPDKKLKKDSSCTIHIKGYAPIKNAKVQNITPNNDDAPTNIKIAFTSGGKNKILEFDFSENENKEGIYSYENENERKKIPLLKFEKIVSVADQL